MESKWVTVITNFILRAILGMGLIFFINNYVLPDDNTLKVGLNAVSFLTSGTLGIPGVCLLYGILMYQIL
ncbi:pro-sigmaK processing inhibitor BofA family protein [Mediterraneibacter agrestimuris]|uniref:pro-sigmaK processing inhibitor BofA family protein n=1 Tax=Mediterraneibacter agrestimuris TaxID=2941333 RepID=UPI00203CF58A|nr:pro-sigmaK processing inhibitor BofA family protein [Mediterraneibacter agrestimuris]